MVKGEPEKAIADFDIAITFNSSYLNAYFTEVWHLFVPPHAPVPFLIDSPVTGDCKLSL